MLTEEIHYRILKAIEGNPAVSQRELAALLGVSLGKTNYCLKELVKQGLIKAGKFKANPDKRVYTYLLTPQGVKEKSKAALRFLQKKMDEYEQIKKEIAHLRAEVEDTDKTAESLSKSLAEKSHDLRDLSCFKAYDIRGRIPDELNDDIAYRIGRAYAAYLTPRRVIVGYDIRLSSPSLASSLINGLTDGGVDVDDIGLCGTEMVYFATFHTNADGGIMVTASHNPKDYNGMKLVREGSRPISGDSGLQEIHRRAQLNEFMPASFKGNVSKCDVMESYVGHLLGYIEHLRLTPLRIVVNAGNGGAGLIIDQLEQHLPFQFIKTNHEPDGNFPNGIPNPLLPECRQDTIDAIQTYRADFGIAWDGDYDRCFLFDENGNFIEGYYIVGLLAQAFLGLQPGSKIVHDPRLTWNTIELVEEAGGVPVMSKTGHAFIKERMRKEDAVYGGEMSAHHYFRDFAYCDSGMVPWLLIVGLLSARDKPLSKLLAERMERYPASGEINRIVRDSEQVLALIKQRYSNDCLKQDMVDGLSMEFHNWRFNIRASNTEPVLRLNVESRGDTDLMEAKTNELLTLIDEMDD